MLSKEVLVLPTFSSDINTNSKNDTTFSIMKEYDLKSNYESMPTVACR